MEHDGQGGLLIITHAALQMIAHWRNKGQWHLVVDEEITSECHIPIRLKRPETRAALCDLFRVRPWDDTYSVLEAVDHGKIMDIRDNLYDDQIDEMFAPLTMRLLPFSCWNLFVKTAHMAGVRRWQEQSLRRAWPSASAIAGWLRQREGHGRQHRRHLDGRVLAQDWAQYAATYSQACDAHRRPRDHQVSAGPKMEQAAARYGGGGGIRYNGRRDVCSAMR